MAWWPGAQRPLRSKFPATGIVAVALLATTVLAPVALAQDGIRVALGATQPDGAMAPPDVSHLVVHWSLPVPPPPTQAQRVLWSIEGGPEASAPAQLVGVARDTSPVQEAAAQPQYAARLQPVPRGAEVTYRVAVGDTVSEPRTVRMVPFEDRAVRIAALAHIGYAGFDEATGARLPGVPAPAQEAVNATLALAPDLVLLPGNIAMSTSVRPWDITLGILEPLAGTVPVMAVPGAAELDQDVHQLRERFVLPLTEPGRIARTATYTTVDDATTADDAELLYHAFSAGPVYVIGLSSDTLCRPLVPSVPQVNPPAVGIPPCAVGQLDAVQPTWLHDVLEDAREDYNATWIVVQMASGPYVHADDGSNHLVKDVLVPILEDYGVDVVLSSSEAIYQRSHPLRGGQPQAQLAGPGAQGKAGAGTIYVTTGGGGWSEAQAMTTPWPSWLAASSEGQHTFALDATRATLTLTARTLDGTLLDAVTLHKPASPGYAGAAGSGSQAGEDAPRAEAPLTPLAALAALAGALLARRRAA